MRTLHEDNLKVPANVMWQPKLPPISVPARAAGRGRPRPLYLRIVDALAADVASGRVAADTRLPTQRELAERLGTTIATVTRAYSEARRRGLVSATVGRGTFVHAAPAHATSGIADLTVNQLLATPFGGELIAAASTIDPDLLTSLLEYQPHTGHERHRRVMARWSASLPAITTQPMVYTRSTATRLAALTRASV